jgi:hypothetical protein
VEIDGNERMEHATETGAYDEEETVVLIQKQGVRN